MCVNACAHVQGFTGTLISVKRNEWCLTFHFLLLDTLFERYEWQKVLCVAFCTRPRAIWKWCVSPQWYTWHSSCELLSWMTSFFFLSTFTSYSHLYVFAQAWLPQREQMPENEKFLCAVAVFLYACTTTNRESGICVRKAVLISAGAAIYSLVTGHIG